MSKQPSLNNLIMKSIKSKVVAATITEAAQPSRVENVNGEGRKGRYIRMHGMGVGGGRLDGWMVLVDRIGVVENVMFKLHRFDTRRLQDSPGRKIQEDPDA